jgi:hypothetical protein
MTRRALAPLFVAVSMALAGQALAADEKKEGKEAKGDVGQYVDLRTVGLPIVSQGELVNYVFVYVRVNLTSSANVTKLRDMEPFFRDALIRAGHRQPFTLATDLGKVDERRVTAVLYREAAAIAGPGQIRSVVVTSQASRRRVITPPAKG